MRRISFVLGVTTLFCSSLSFSAQAQDAGKGSSRAAAEALFNQGRALMAAGKVAEACPKFEASQQLDPGLGTMLNLAECYEKTGRTASAWAEYREAIPLARAAGSKARQDLATERAHALEERLSTLTIRAMAGDAPNAQLEVRRDGVALQTAELGAPIPVDPGEHSVEASSPGKKPWSTKVQIGANAAKVAVEVPALQADGSASPAIATPAVTTTTTASPATAAAASDEGKPGNGQRITGLVLGGAGVIGLGVGTIFGLQASGKWSDAKAECKDYPFDCGTKGADSKSEASSAASIATIGFVAGGVLLAAGAVLYFTAPSAKTQVALSVGPGSAFVKGSF